jgi:hypothetical protein
MAEVKRKSRFRSALTPKMGDHSTNLSTPHFNYGTFSSRSLETKSGDFAKMGAVAHI